jgi:hypothetical protein
MDFVVTEAGLHAVGAQGLERIDAAECAARALKLRDERGLPRAQPNVKEPASPVCYAADFPADRDGGNS